VYIYIHIHRHIFVYKNVRNVQGCVSGQRQCAVVHKKDAIKLLDEQNYESNKKLITNE
jgi:hypothetical protein